ncbi:MAG: sulfatase-like hydrolase/transferase [Salinibacter sp.]
MADDLGYGDVGACGQKKIHTPALDGLAREGTVFTQFYSGSAVCAPARSVLMTGRHTGHTPIRDNKEVTPIGQHPLPDSSVTMAEVLSGAGYRTAAMGKRGLGPPALKGRPPVRASTCSTGIPGSGGRTTTIRSFSSTTESGSPSPETPSRTIGTPPGPPRSGNIPFRRIRKRDGPRRPVPQ